LTSFQYKSIKQTIGTLAIEDMFVSKEKIDRSIEIATGKIIAKRSIEQTKNRLDSEGYLLLEIPFSYNTL